MQSRVCGVAGDRSSLSKRLRASRKNRQVSAKWSRECVKTNPEQLQHAVTNCSISQLYSILTRAASIYVFKKTGGTPMAHWDSIDRRRGLGFSQIPHWVFRWLSIYASKYRTESLAAAKEIAAAREAVARETLDEFGRVEFSMSGWGTC
jgi:hypothetical protein